MQPIDERVLQVIDKELQTLKLNQKEFNDSFWSLVDTTPAVESQYCLPPTDTVGRNISYNVQIDKSRA